MKYEPSWISVETIISFHDYLIDQHGGNPGIHSRPLLEGAANAPRQRYCYGDGEPTIEALAACYGYHLAKDHPFSDGNKRTAATTSIAFLRINQFDLDASNDDIYETFMAVADGEITLGELITWFEVRTTRRSVWKK